MNHDLSPVVVFVFNRPSHAEKTLKSLAENHLADKTDVIVFSDGPRGDGDAQSVKETRQVLKNIKGFRSFQVFESEKNLGLAKSIIQGVSKVCDERGKIIVLEDDMVTSKFFLTYMNDALFLYEKDESVISIHGYVYPLATPLPGPFFLKGADCWGWATWKRGWSNFNPDGKELLRELTYKKLLDRFNFNGSSDYEGMLKDSISGKNNSWAVRWYASALLKNKLTLYPNESLVENIGLDSSGTHCEVDQSFSVKLAENKISLPGVPQNESPEAYQLFCKFFKSRLTMKQRLKLMIRKNI